jgi:hypothetical protein
VTLRCWPHCCWLFLRHLPRPLHAKPRRTTAAAQLLRFLTVPSPIQLRLSFFLWRHRVVDVRYVIANDGTDRTLAQLTLQLSDDASPLKASCRRCAGCTLLGTGSFLPSREENFCCMHLKRGLKLLEGTMLLLYVGLPAVPPLRPTAWPPLFPPSFACPPICRTPALRLRSPPPPPASPSLWCCARASAPPSWNAAGPWATAARWALLPAGAAIPIKGCRGGGRRRADTGPAPRM